MVMLVTMIITGITLAMHYTPHVDMAFDSVEHIMRDVNHGWLIRYLHMNGGSFFFIAVYIHIFRGCIMGLIKTAGIALDFRGRYFPADDGHRLYGLCVAVGADELLGRDGDYQFVFRDPAGRG